MEFIFAYLAGVLTLINPCVLPVLPIVLATALQVSPKGPLALAAGLGTSFVVVGVLVSSVGLAFGILAEDVARIGAILMIGFGTILLVPAFSGRFTLATTGFSERADQQIEAIDRSTLRGQFLGGLLLGAVWSPCVGPTLGGAIALAAQGQNLAKATLIMMFFAFGVATIVLLLAYGARATLLKRRDFMRKLASKSRAIMGVMFIVVGVAILLEFHIAIERWALQNMPSWLVDFSVSI